MKNMPLEKALRQAGIKWLVTPREEILITQIAAYREERAKLSIYLNALLKENGFENLQAYKKFMGNKY